MLVRDELCCGPELSCKPEYAKCRNCPRACELNYLDDMNLAISLVKEMVTHPINVDCTMEYDKDGFHWFSTYYDEDREIMFEFGVGKTHEEAIVDLYLKFWCRTNQDSPLWGVVVNGDF
jgi:hypothetical protein